MKEGEATTDKPFGVEMVTTQHPSSQQASLPVPLELKNYVTLDALLPITLMALPVHVIMIPVLSKKARPGVCL